MKRVWNLAGPFFVLLGVALLVAAPERADAKSKGLPSSDDRRAYCSSKEAECLAEAGRTCKETYDKAEHLAACIEYEVAECGRRYGLNSSCLTSPRGIPDPRSPRGAAGGGVIGEGPPLRPRTTLPKATDESGR